MKEHRGWSRRAFLQKIGCFSALGVVDPRMVWRLSANRTPAQTTPASKNGAHPSFAYIGSGRDGIQTFSVQGNNWRKVHTVSSKRPAALALHPTGNFLYAVNAIDTYRGLPMGTAESYRIDREGRLALLNRQPLSLSATMPRHLAVSPDGRNLVIAIDGGGSYNVLPVAADGSLGKVSGILKETGSGPDQQRQNASHPQAIAFDPTGLRILTADLGSDRLNVFNLEEDRLIVAHRKATPPGSGPRSLAIHPSGRTFYVMNELNSSLSCFGYDSTSGRILDRLQHLSFQVAEAANETHKTSMAMHESGEFLYTSVSTCTPRTSGKNTIAVWRIDGVSGFLRPIQKSAINEFPIESMSAARNSLFVLAHGDGVYRFDIHPTSGILKKPVQVARVRDPRSIALLYREG